MRPPAAPAPSPTAPHRAPGGPGEQGTREQGTREGPAPGMLRQPGAGGRPRSAAPGEDGGRGASGTGLVLWYLSGTPQTPQTPATPGRSGRNSTGFSLPPRPNTNSRHRLRNKTVPLPVRRRARCARLQSGASPAPVCPSREGSPGAPPARPSAPSPPPARASPPSCPRTTCPGGQSSWSAWCCGRCRRLCRRNPSPPPSHRVREAAHSPLS